MNLFWKKLFGGLASTPKFEEQCAEMEASFLRYVKVQQSDELKEYEELFKKVKSPEFRDNKKMLTTRKYKDTQEYRDMTKYEKLHKSADVVEYYKVLGSKELDEFRKFEKSGDYAKLANADEVKKSELLSRMKSYERSKEYKLYRRLNGSYVIKEYEELKEKVNTEEFKKSNAFWSDPNRWSKTKEAAVEERFNALAKSDDIVFYLKENKGRFAEIEKFERVYRDDFNSGSLDKKAWAFGFYHKSEELKRLYSFTNEQQANAGGANVTVAGGCMHIATSQRKMETTAWDAKKGFVKKEFDYTADVVNLAGVANRRGGMFRAKMKCDGAKEVSHAFCLYGEKNTPRVNIFKCEDGRIELGIYTKSGYRCEKIKGISPEDFYVYTLVWSDREMVWYINNLEVMRVADGVPAEDMYPLFNSYIAEGKTPGEGGMDIGLVDIFARKG